MMKKTLFLFIGFLVSFHYASAQNIGSSPEYIKALTAEWQGERFPDGRPKVSDRLLERLKNISMEEAWGVLRSKGYMNQFESGWMILNPDEPMTGRVVTAQYMPLRPDYDKYIR